MVRPIINSEKRIVQVTLTNVVVNTAESVNIVIGLQDPSAAAPSNVLVGSIVKAVYCEMWVMGTNQQPSTITTLIHKVEGGSSNIDATEFTNLNTYNQKKNILEMHQGLIGDANTNPVPFYRGWVKIPKGKQRIGINDRIQFSIKAITEDVQFCGIFIYKVYN